MPNSLLGICFWAGVPEGAVERGEWGLMVRSLSGDCRTEEGLEEAIGGEFGRLPTDEPVLSHVRKQRIRKRERRSLQTLQNSLRIPAPKNNRPSAPPEQDQEFPQRLPAMSNEIIRQGNGDRSFGWLQTSQTEVSLTTQFGHLKYYAIQRRRIAKTGSLPESPLSIRETCIEVGRACQVSSQERICAHKLNPHNHVH